MKFTSTIHKLGRAYALQIENTHFSYVHWTCVYKPDLVFVTYKTVNKNSQILMINIIYMMIHLNYLNKIRNLSLIWVSYENLANTIGKENIKPGINTGKEVIKLFF